MNINPKLSGAERVASVVAGIGVVAYASLGGIDATWIRVVCIGFGLAFVVGGIGGT